MHDNFVHLRTNYYTFLGIMLKQQFLVSGLLEIEITGRPKSNPQDKEISNKLSECKILRTFILKLVRHKIHLLHKNHYIISWVHREMRF